MIFWCPSTINFSWISVFRDWVFEGLPIDWVHTFCFTLYTIILIHCHLIFLSGEIPGAPCEAQGVPWNPGTPCESQGVPSNPGTPCEAQGVPWNPGAPCEAQGVPWNPGTPCEAQGVPWNPGAPCEAQGVPWNPGAPSNPPLPEFHVEWSENCLITPYPYLHLVLISIYLFIHLHISMSITFYAFLDRFDRPIRLNVRPLQLASAPFHHSSPLKSPPLPCSFHSSQQSTPPFDPQPRTYSFSLLLPIQIPL